MAEGFVLSNENFKYLICHDKSKCVDKEGRSLDFRINFSCWK